ncbi:hypothetical protein GCM10009849_36240 [Sinomonas flava]|uniref:Uncharacterized protein n=1 Tax=Sinomonas flava TaxID=496857 RepID=A0ABP5NV50_9MICC
MGLVAWSLKGLAALLDGWCLVIRHRQEPRALTEATAGQRCAATMIFNLPEYRVLSVAVTCLGIRPIHR